MKLTILIISVWLILTNSVLAVEINGNHFYSDNELTRLIDFKMPDDSIVARIESLYRSAGYFNIQVATITKNPKNEKVIDINEGNPIIIDTINIQLIPSSPVIMNDLELDAKGKIASQKTFNNIARECIDRLAQNGMPFASGQWTNFDFDSSGHMTAAFRVMAGPVTKISNLRFEGTRRTKPSILIKIANLKIGHDYSETKIRESQKLIDQMPYIDITAPYDVEPISDGASSEVIYHIRELPSTRFDGAVGLIRSNNRSSFIGRVNLEFGDIFGTGRSFGFLWNKKDKYSGEIRLNYLEPFIFNSRFDMKLEAFQVDRDSSFIQTGGRMGFVYSFGSGLNGGLYLTLERTEPEERSSVVSSQGSALRVEFDYDRTDYRDNPHSGYGIGSDLNYKYRSNRGNVDSLGLPTRLTSAGLQLRYYLSPSTRFVLAFRLSGWGIVSSNGTAPIDEFHYLGGFDNLRGYASDRFSAYRYGLATIEPRLIAGRNGRAYLFADMAAIKSSPDNSSDYIFYPGCGLGVAAPSALGLFKIEVGWGKHGFPSDPVFNFGVAGSF